MAASTDGSSDEEKIAHSKKKKSTTNNIVSSSDEEDNNVKHISGTPNDVGTSGLRRSQRKRKQRFRMPSREEQRNAITTSPVSPRLSHLKPRKLINDFTRVTHRYNYDFVEVSGEESMEEFIKDTDSSQSESTDTDGSSTKAVPQSDTKRQHRVKGYRPRIANLSDSSEDETEGIGQSNLMKQQNPVTKSTENREPHVKKENELSEETPLQNAVKGSMVTVGEEPQVVKLKGTRKSRKKSVLDSDSDDLSEHMSPGDAATLSILRKSNNKRQLVFKSDSENQSSDASEKEGSEEAVKMPRKRTKPAIDSDSDDNTDTGEKKPLPHEDVNGTKDEKEIKASTSSEAQTRPVDQNCSTNQNISSNKSWKKECSDTGYSESTTSGEDSDGTENGSESSEHGGRIQKLASEKRKKRESLFGQLKSAREKRQKKT
ncbi:hypothetical protein V1264_001773 [Littorina saxatilis]|uniref:Uncharacterized protein n=2 Tax=Littorina saxatilis TaxID=31220 RepID=A0AAN9C270_9CAEN